MTCDSLFVGRAGLNEKFSTILVPRSYANDIDRITPPLQILDDFYRFEFDLDNDNLFWVLSIEVDSIGLKLLVPSTSALKWNFALIAKVI
jgi:hypothetical protein